MGKKRSDAVNWSAIQREESAKAHSQELKDRDEQIQRYSEALTELKDQLDTALAIEASPVKIRPIVETDPDESEATAFAIASDWHAEERVNPESVNYLNDVSLAVTERRIANFFQNVVRLTQIQREGTKIDTLVLALLGDHMTGYIHEELQESNELSPTQTIIWLRDRILAGLEYLEQHGGFSRIVIPCCYGNHGRTTKKPRHATGAANSFEWLLYRVLAKHAPQFEWHIAESYHTFLPVYGKQIRLHHGDAIRYEGGIGGLTIPVEKAIAAWNKAKVADLDIFGHWHTQQQNPKWVSNGSLIGYNAFSVAIKAPFEPPQQTYFLFDSKRGRTGTWPIFL